MQIHKDLEMFTISKDATLLEAAQQIERNCARAVIVVEKDKALGILSEGDLMRALLKGTDIRAQVMPFLKIAFIFLKSVDKDEIFRLFRRYLVSLIPIVDEEMHLKGIVTLENLFACMQLVDEPEE